MGHEKAKDLLLRAHTFSERTEAVKAALALGMPLREIEQYLDWLDHAKRQRDDAARDESRSDH
jgi:hypothetical protein